MYVCVVLLWKCLEEKTRKLTTIKRDEDGGCALDSRIRFLAHNGRLFCFFPAVYFLFLTGAKIELRAVKTADRWLWLLAGFAGLDRRRRCLGFCF